MNRLAALTLLSLGLASGCAGTTFSASVAMAKSLGTRQCESGGPTAEVLAQSLRDAGIPVLAVSCGHDGRMRPARCGGADGRLAIVDIPEDQQAQAESRGWRLLATLPDASRQPC